MKELSIKKGELLQRSGEFNTKVYQVKTGLLRSYSIDNNGKENIFMFAPEGWVIADSTSPEEESDLFIDAIEDAVVLQSEKSNIGPHDIPKLLKRLKVLQKRVILLMSASALQRYEHFITTYPEIVQRVPQKMIASYLGITPEALSTVRRKRIKKK